MTTEIEKKTPSVIGVVASNKMDKTIVVLVERKVQLPLYRKYVKRFSRMVAHDENNQCQIGDTVEIKQSRPLSKTKTWVLVDVLERAKV